MRVKWKKLNGTSLFNIFIFLSRSYPWIEKEKILVVDPKGEELPPSPPPPWKQWHFSLMKKKQSYVSLLPPPSLKNDEDFFNSWTCKRKKAVEFQKFLDPSSPKWCFGSATEGPSPWIFQFLKKKFKVSEVTCWLIRFLVVHSSTRVNPIFSFYIYQK